MSKRVPIGAIIVVIVTVLATMAAVVFHPISRHVLFTYLPLFTMAGMVGALIAWWLWDRRLFAPELERLRETKRWQEVIAGAVMSSASVNATGRLRRGKVVLAVGAEGIQLFDPRTPGEEAVWSAPWSDVETLSVDHRYYGGKTRRGVNIVTKNGRVLVAVRVYEYLGVLGLGGIGAAEYVETLRGIQSANAAV